MWLLGNSSTMKREITTTKAILAINVSQKEVMHGTLPVSLEVTAYDSERKTIGNGQHTAQLKTGNPNPTDC